MRDEPDVCVNPQKSSVKSDTENLKSTKWKPVLLPLNPNFLRLSMDRNEEFSDEFAVMLQNEEFLAELRFVFNSLKLFKSNHGKLLLHKFPQVQPRISLNS